MRLTWQKEQLRSTSLAKSQRLKWRTAHDGCALSVLCSLLLFLDPQSLEDQVENEGSLWSPAEGIDLPLALATLLSSSTSSKDEETLLCQDCDRKSQKRGVPIWRFILSWLDSPSDAAADWAQDAASASHESDSNMGSDDDRPERLGGEVFTPVVREMERDALGVH